MTKARILVVEDNRVIAYSLLRTLNSSGFDVSSIVSSGEEALKKAEKDDPDLVLMDIVLEGEMDGIEAAAQIRSQFNIPVVFLTAYSDKKMLKRAKQIEPFGYIIKPFGEKELSIVIEIALYKHMIERRLKESEEWLSITLKSIGDAVIATDAKGKVKFMNPVAQALTRWKEEEIAGKSLKEVFNIINEETGKPAENFVLRIIRGCAEASLPNHTVLIAKDGTKVPIHHRSSPIKDGRGNIIGVVLTFHDFSERRRARKKTINSY